MNIGIKTLGCKSNRYESDRIFDELILKGHKVVEIEDMASSFFKNSLFKPDILVINTCTVTQIADKKSRQAIKSFRETFPNSKMLVFGCGVNVGTVGIEANYFDFMAKNRDEILNYIYSVEQFFRTEPDLAPVLQRTRALIKIQDGCENFCTYCIIAHARGKEKSFPSGDIIKEVQEKEANGFKEIIITGINIGKWKENDLGFPDLIELMLSSTKDIRFRISSIEPVDFSEKFYKLFKYSRLCPQIHLSLQSGSEKILKLMNRNYEKSEFLNICEKLYKANPDFAITTDVIVGFPGESDLDFLETCDFVEKIGFLKTHVFPYSKRNKTPASHFPNQIDSKIKKERAKVLRNISDEMGKSFMQRYIGKEMTVLVEGGKGPFRKGLSSNFISVKFKGDAKLRNSYVQVRILGVSENGLGLEGEIVER